MPSWAIWLILSGALFILEIITVSFLMFWPAIAAFIVFILAILEIGNTQIRIAVFCIVSILLIVFMKPLTKKFFKVNETATNIKSIIGKKGIVLKSIDNVNGKGQVKVAGEIWSAISATNEIIPVDSLVEIVSIEGVKIKVKVLKEDN